jgi:hypothetical protein
VKLFDKVGGSAVSMTLLWPTPQIQLCKLGSKSQRHSSINDIAVPGDLDFERLWLPSVAEPHHFDTAQAPGKNFDAALASTLYSRPKC